MPFASPGDVSKADLRGAVLAQRDAMPADDRAAAAAAVAGRRFPRPLPPGTVVSGYSPLRSEINPLPLMRRLAELGAKLALPVVTRRGLPLVFRAFAFGDPLSPGVWGIREPPPEAPEVLPDVLIVPLAAFDRRGHRIGYGAGYYDRSLAALRAQKPVVAAGLAFSGQEIPCVPATAQDERLDLVLTEREVIDLRGT
jgi:5-formyltetrahydrofolate cyclo-ligase